MRTVTLPAKVCHCQHRADALCRMLPTCKKCGSRLWKNFNGLCEQCQKKLAADAHAYRLLQAERMILEIMQGVNSQKVPNDR